MYGGFCAHTCFLARCGSAQTDNVRFSAGPAPELSLQAFDLDPIARISGEFARNQAHSRTRSALVRVAVDLSKHVIALAPAHYGSSLARRYFIGCRGGSTGERGHGLSRGHLASKQLGRHHADGMLDGGPKISFGLWRDPHLVNLGASNLNSLNML
jgi:hypothetical protein